VRFFVKNINDHIQSFHYYGIFYEKEELEMIENHFKPGDTFVDFGSNCGNHLLFVHHFLRPKEIIPFEVNPSAIEILRINININNCLNVDGSYLGLGVSDRDGRISVASTIDNNLGATCFRSDVAGSFLTIPGDRVLFDRPVNFIKIDLEGMEVDALTGITQTIDRWRPKLLIEIQDHNLSPILNILETFDYELVDVFCRYGGMANYLFVSLRHPRGLQ
jgi:FkbM family methyltransferase